MPLQRSKMAPLGTPLPSFSLPDVVSGRVISSADLLPDKPVLVMFICAHCPFTRHIAAAVRGVARDYASRVNLLAISANDPSQVPEDSPDGLKRLAGWLELSSPFLFDASQETARAFSAECTPECFLYDAERRLVYRGEIDASRPGSATPPTGAPVRAALDALLAGRPIDPDQRPGMGCNIKWRSGAAYAAV